MGSDVSRINCRYVVGLCVNGTPGDVYKRESDAVKNFSVNVVAESQRGEGAELVRDWSYPTSLW